MRENLIIVPYAYLKQRSTGENIKHSDKAQIIYCRNLCVALVSAKLQNPEDDVALVTNLETVPSEYQSLLDSYGIQVIHQEFDSFLFDDGSKWQLAFYKLCVLKAIPEKYPHRRYLMMDTDVFVQNSFRDIWQECDRHVLLYDINHGLQVADYRHFLEEVYDLTGERRLITHYGGEFFCAAQKDALKFVDQCLNVYNDMKEKKRSLLSEMNLFFLLRRKHW